MWGQKYGTKLVFVHFFYSSMSESSKMWTIGRIGYRVIMSKQQMNSRRKCIFKTSRSKGFSVLTASQGCLFSFPLFFRNLLDKDTFSKSDPCEYDDLASLPELARSHILQKVIYTSLSSPFSSFLPFIWPMSLWACCSVTWEIFVVFFARTASACCRPCCG